MYHHMEIFKKVDVIVTPTTGYVCDGRFNKIQFNWSNVDTLSFVVIWYD